jgi:hypothetical protein
VAITIIIYVNVTIDDVSDADLSGEQQTAESLQGR